jgi:hypothetical protein
LVEKIVPIVICTEKTGKGCAKRYCTDGKASAADKERGKVRLIPSLANCNNISSSFFTSSWAGATRDVEVRETSTQENRRKVGERKGVRCIFHRPVRDIESPMVMVCTLRMDNDFLLLGSVRVLARGQIQN